MRKREHLGIKEHGIKKDIDRDLMIKGFFNKGVRGIDLALGI